LSYPRVPDREAVGWQLLNARHLLQHNRQAHCARRVRPHPLGEDPEEPVDEGGRTGVRVELTDARDEYSPADAAQVAHGVRVDAVLFGPELDGAQREPESVHVGY